jgi:hypothetical protein
VEKVKVTCNDIDNLLVEGDAFSMEHAAKHAAECSACSEKLAAWNEISGTARTMRTEWRSDLLWPRIERALSAEKRRRMRSRLWQVAAAIVLTVGIGAGSWYAIRAQRNAAFDQAILRFNALDEVERAERAHIESINRLEKVAEPKLEHDDSPLMVSYKEKLLLLDDAIAECQANIDRNRQNAHLRRELLAIYSEKQKTLQDVLREGNHAPNQ